MTVPVSRWPWTTAGVVALLLLGSCSSKQNDVGAPPCPRVGVLADAAHMTVYRNGPGRDLTDIAYEADLGRITGECVYDRRITKVTVNMKLVITAKRGPADRDHVAGLPYFVAIVDNQSKVLARQEFDSSVEFAPEQSQVGVQEELEQIIPLTKGQPGSDFEVLVGFQLNREQLQRNRGSAQ